MYGIANCEEGLIYKLLILNIYQTLVSQLSERQKGMMKKGMA